MYIYICISISLLRALKLSVNDTSIASLGGLGAALGRLKALVFCTASWLIVLLPMLV